jgi:hypothetical protein
MNREPPLQPRTVRHRVAFLEQLKKTPVVLLSAEKTGISKATVYRWRERNVEFAAEMDRALEEGKMLVNDVAESQLMAAIKERNLTAIIFWLKHHHRDYATKVEINATVRDEYELTPEQKAIVREALRLATSPKIGGMPAGAAPEDEIERKAQ